ncbi:unnamed protein product [Adineta steineri]|uniref:Cell division cycle protein 123 homolog n=1 Tax=Adineta steineri TaxID=433720 RepID=A0A815KB77_9BILA|nr:unnamed protein product [Adineta steineri]CAF3836372.1 unnamed protein product [Adineta steineri]
MGQNESTTHKNNVIDKSNNNSMDLSPQFYERKLLKRCEHIDFDIDAWYKILHSQTFHTEFISISPTIARAFVNYYQTRYNSKNFLTFNDLKSIQSIQDQLKEQINGSFIRLSSRSPKDGQPLDLETLKKFYYQQLNLLKTNYPNEYDTINGKANIEMTAYCYGQFHSLKVTNEFEALNLILSSERIFLDLLDALYCQEVQDKKNINLNNIKLHDWNNSIIIREWNNFLDPSMEFRCFVYQSNLTAISQYNHYCKFYHLQNDLIIQQIKNVIIKYWEEKLKPILDKFTEKYSNCIIDIGVIKNNLTDEFECIVIEMNPFASSTGASLFNWKIDYDQLTGQKNDIEIRIRSDFYPNIDEYIKFVFQKIKFNSEDNVLHNDDDDDEPYFLFLNKIKTQLSA